MPTIKPRVTITMDSGQLNKIEEYRFKHRCKNQTQAILSLIEAGLATLKPDVENALMEASLTEEDIEIAKKYHDLDAHGKKIVNLVINEEAERCKPSATTKEPKLYTIANVARGQKPLQLTEEQMRSFAESARNAPNDAHNKDMF